jgi:DNA-binding transcriptional LysR family regulator
MNFDLADLRAFLSVADFASFRAASDNLHLSQSALSRRIDKLEAALGVKLFSRTTRKVELTTVGRAFVPKARNVMRELEDALVGIKDTTERISGQVTIACVPSAVGYFLPVAIKRFHAAYPRVRIRLIDESSAEILVAVQGAMPTSASPTSARRSPTSTSSRCSKSASSSRAPRGTRSQSTGG